MPVPYERGNKWVGPIRVAGRQQWVGSFNTKKEWKDAAAELRLKMLAEKPADEQTIEVFAAQLWLTLKPRPKDTSNEKLAADIKPLVTEFGTRKFAEIGRLEARTWMSKQRTGVVKACRSMWNDAIEAGATTADNPFARPGIKEGKGRANIEVLSDAEIELLLASIREVFPDDYGKTLVALVATAAYTAARPGELFALEWGDLRLADLEADICRRFDGKGRLDYPKTDAGCRTIVVPPAARDAILAMEKLDSRYVFVALQGKPFRKNGWVYYWHPIRSAFLAKLDEGHWLRQRVAANKNDNLDFYELRHYGCTRFLELGASAEDVAVQLGHRGPELVYTLYGHPSKARALSRLKLLDSTIRDSDLQELLAD